LPSYKLISNSGCPYAQRTAIVLREKNVEHETVAIDFRNRPDWFQKVSPHGKVPVLLVDDEHAIFESAVINEYLDEVTRGPSLLPAEPLERARARMWIEFSSSLSSEHWDLMLCTDAEQGAKLVASLKQKFARLEAELSNGTYFNGETFTLVDASTAPMLLRLHWMSNFAPSLGLFDDVPKVSAWTAKLVTRESVVASVPADSEARYGDALRAGMFGQEPGWMVSQANA
jgi:glutathione S-transferase